MVAREEIERLLWGPGGAGHEQGINACVREIRRALGDDSRAPSFVETVAKRGYRFIAPIEPETNANAPATRVDVRRRTRSRGPVSLGVLTIFALAAALWAWRGPSGGSAPVWVAIAPVQHGGSAADERVAEALVTDIISKCRRLSVERLRVTRWDTQWGYNRASGTVERDGRPLGVDYLIETELRATEGRASIVLHLFRAGDGALVWSRTVARSEPRVLSGVDEAGSAVAQVVLQLGRRSALAGDR